MTVFAMSNVEVTGTLQQGAARCTISDGASRRPLGLAVVQQLADLAVANQFGDGSHCAESS